MISITSAVTAPFYPSRFFTSITSLLGVVDGLPQTAHERAYERLDDLGLLLDHLDASDDHTAVEVWQVIAVRQDNGRLTGGSLDE